MKVVYVTGNPEKARNFSRHLGTDIPHAAAELDEIQSLDMREIVLHKARQAYEKLGSPVLVEDVALSCTALAGLPGPFVKFFVDADSELESGLERMCRMLDGFTDRSAVASCIFAFYDGNEPRFFEGKVEGSISDHPRGSNGFGFDRILIPDGSNGTTAAQFDENAYDAYYSTIKPFQAIRGFLSEVM